MTPYSKQLDDTRKTLAEYWEDGPGTVTPPGHWNQFTQWVALRLINTLDENASPVLHPQQRPVGCQHQHLGRQGPLGLDRPIPHPLQHLNHNTTSHGQPVRRRRGARLPESSVQHKVQPWTAIGMSSWSLARRRHGGRQSTALFERIPSPLTLVRDLGKRRSAQTARPIPHDEGTRQCGQRRVR
jgi:hypothetical protein